MLIYLRFQLQFAVQKYENLTEISSMNWIRLKEMLKREIIGLFGGNSL